MDFTFSADEQAFRGKVRSFLAENFPPELRDLGLFEDLINDEERWQMAIGFLKTLSKNGWIAPHWPVEYGGAGMSIMEQLIYNEEMALFGAHPGIGPGVTMVGPTLIHHGTEAQRMQHLSGMTSGEVTWCQGYSEPGAGSDLASLQTRAVLDGDDYVVNGQKIWTSFATRAHWMFLLARTDPEAPKHRGISAMLLDMSTPGVSIRPITNLLGQPGFINEVFFENVRIPRSNVVGEPNRGWYVGATLLDFERSNIAAAARGVRDLENFTRECQERLPAGGSLRSTARLALANHAIEIEVGRHISYRVASIQNRGEVPNTEASVAKLFHSEIGQRFQNTKVNILGLIGQVRPDVGTAGARPTDSAMSYMRSIPSTIAGGTSEVQRNIIATRGLGLPKA